MTTEKHCNRCCENHKNDGVFSTISTTNNNYNSYFVTAASADYVNITTTYNGTTFTNYINGIAVSFSNDCACECHDLCGDCDCNGCTND